MKSLSPSKTTSYNFILPKRDFFRIQGDSNYAENLSIIENLTTNRRSRTNSAHLLGRFFVILNVMCKKNI